MITGGGSRAANIPPKTNAFRMRSLELASAEGMVKVEIKARTKIISANFFHIRDPSFRMVLFVFYFFRRKVKKIYSIRIGMGRWKQGEDPEHRRDKRGEGVQCE